MKSFFRFVLKQSLAMNIIVVLVMAFGLYKVLNMQKEAFPNVNFDYVLITTPYPGASPKEVELYVTSPIEQEIKLISGIKKIGSASLEGFSFIYVEIDPNSSDKDKTKTVEDIRSSVQRVKDLPKELPQSPAVREIGSEDLSVLEVCLYGDSYSDLYDTSEEISKLIEDIADVSGVVKKGFNKREYWIEISSSKLQLYNISLANILAILTVRNLNLPGGIIDTENGEYLVRTVGELTNIEDISNVVVRTNDSGSVLKISDLGIVKESFEDKREINKVNGLMSINLSVHKSQKGDIVRLVDEVKRVTDDYLHRNKELQINAAYTNDLSIFVRNRLGVLWNNALVGLALVVLSLLLFLSPGIALITAIGMPIAFLASLAVMAYMGITINLITLFAMIIVLGLLIDNSIIVGENIWQHHEMGKKPFDAVVQGTLEVVAPVVSTALTTIAAFLPLMFLSGLIGKFIFDFPVVVIICLGASLIAVMFVLPSHAYGVLAFEKKHSKATIYKKVRFDKLISLYQTLLVPALKFRYILVLVGFVVFIASMVFAYYKMPIVLFPKEGIDIFYVRAEFHQKAGLEETAAGFKGIEQIISNIPDTELREYVTTVGAFREGGRDPLSQYAPNLAQIAVYLTPENKRSRKSDEIVSSLRPLVEEYARQKGFVSVTFSNIHTGPPVDKAVSLKVSGDDFDVLNLISSKLINKLNSIEGVSDISQNFKQGREEVQVLVDEQRASRSLLSVRDIALQVRGSFDGVIAGYIRTNTDRYAIRIRAPEEDRSKLKSLPDIHILNMHNQPVKLTDVAKLEQTKAANAIYHTNGYRTITITAEVDQRIITSVQVNKFLTPLMNELLSTNSGVSIKNEGEFEDTQKSLADIKSAFLFALFLIFVILVVQFNNIIQPFIIMTAIPLAVIGVIWAFFFHGLPPSFIGLVGVVGLAGVVVNDSIILVEMLNRARREGMDAIEASLYAGKRRFRAVWLTTVTTVLGLIPLVYGLGGDDAFLRPAALALAYGLIFGALLVLFFVPCFYIIFDDLTKLVKKLLLARS